MAKKETVNHTASLGTYITWLQLTHRLTAEETTTLLSLVDKELDAHGILSQQGC